MKPKKELRGGTGRAMLAPSVRLHSETSRKSQLINAFLYRNLDLMKLQFSPNATQEDVEKLAREVESLGIRVRKEIPESLIDVDAYERRNRAAMEAMAAAKTFKNSFTGRTIRRFSRTPRLVSRWVSKRTGRRTK